MITTRTAKEYDKDFLWKLKVAAMRGYVEQLYGWEDGRQYDHFEKTFHPDIITTIQYHRQDAGMIEPWEREEDLFLSRIEVLPEFQNRGIGTAKKRP